MPFFITLHAVGYRKEQQSLFLTEVSNSYEYLETYPAKV